MPATGAVFLDKDGTVLRDVPYNVNPARMRWSPRAAQALARLGQLGLPLFIVSNQSGVAHGYFPLKALKGVARRLSRMFRQHRAALTACAFCPFDPTGSVPFFARASDDRKPAPGMLLSTAARYGIALQDSWFVGDILDDVEAGARAGCHTLLLDNGNETVWHQTPLRTPDASAPDLRRAAVIIAAACRTPHRQFSEAA